MLQLQGKYIDCPVELNKIEFCSRQKCDRAETEDASPTFN